MRADARRMSRLMVEESGSIFAPLNLLVRQLASLGSSHRRSSGVTVLSTRPWHRAMVSVSIYTDRLFGRRGRIAEPLRLKAALLWIKLRTATRPSPLEAPEAKSRGGISRVFDRKLRSSVT